MARYINYDELLEKWESLGFDEISRIYKVNAFNHFIKNLPTADVVEVVRCKECKYCELDAEHSGNGYESEGYCYWWKSSVGGLDFCSYGERRTDNDV